MEEAFKWATYMFAEEEGFGCGFEEPVNILP